VKIKLILVASILMLVSGQVNAALTEYGNGFVYDDDLNLTWVLDANLAGTTGYSDTLYTYDTDGRMTWPDALTWVDQLVIDDFDDWKLPTQSQMEHLHYDELGNFIYNDPNWVPGHENADPFINVGENHYWSSIGGQIFNFKEGTSNIGTSYFNLFHAWAVHDGYLTVSPIPVPAAVWLFGTALIGLVGFNKARMGDS
jgi:hypothetical protein